MAERTLVSESSEAKLKALPSRLQKVEHKLSIKSSALQAKLRIGQPDDIYEQEADWVAEQVMRMPDPALQRKCAKCDDEKVLQTKKSPGQIPSTLGQDVPPIVHDVLRSPGQSLDSATRSFFEPRFGYDFSEVRVHTDSKAAESARAINALAYTVGWNIMFATGQFMPGTNEGKSLLAHELTHVMQQVGQHGISSSPTIEEDNSRSKQEAKLVVNRMQPQVDSPDRTTTLTKQQGVVGLPIFLGTALPMVNHFNSQAIQRRVSFNVLDWQANRLGPPTLNDSARTINVPPTGQISISALVEINGETTDRCTDHEIGTTQTAWIAWTVAQYRGKNRGDGHITVHHRARMPMRDPDPSGSAWYYPANVRKPSFCGDSVSIFHHDSPHHSIPKMRNNSAVAGNPLNYLRSYTRGLHLVTYLTARDPSGVFLASPLQFIYWNSLQDFTFTPNFANPRQTWTHSGQIQVNIGSKGIGETADAPYFTTAGTNFNDHFNNSANWSIDDQP